MDRIAAHEHALVGTGYRLLSEIDGVTQYGPAADRRGGVLSFNVDGVHPHDVAQILDSEGVCVRAGHHCTQPIMTRFGSPRRTARASTCTTPPRLDALVRGIDRVKRTFARASAGIPASRVH